jgi:hypothetical protein
MGLLEIHLCAAGLLQFGSPHFGKHRFSMLQTLLEICHTLHPDLRRPLSQSPAPLIIKESIIFGKTIVHNTCSGITPRIFDKIKLIAGRVLQFWTLGHMLRGSYEFPILMHQRKKR